MRGELREVTWGRSIGRAGPRGEQGPGEHNQHMLHKRLVLSPRHTPYVTYVQQHKHTTASSLFPPHTHTHTLCRRQPLGGNCPRLLMLSRIETAPVFTRPGLISQLDVFTSTKWLTTALPPTQRDSTEAKLEVYFILCM